MSKYEGLVQRIINYARMKIKHSPFNKDFIYLEATGLGGRDLALHEVEKSLLLISTALCGTCQMIESCPGPLAKTEIGPTTLFLFHRLIKDNRPSRIVSSEIMTPAMFCPDERTSDLQTYGKCQQTTLPKN